MKIYVIGNKDTVLGFRLNGVDGSVVASAAEARQALESALDSEDIGLLLVTRQWGATMQDRMDHLKMHSLAPVVLEIPGSAIRPPEQSIRELVRKAVGLRMD